MPQCKGCLELQANPPKPQTFKSQKLGVTTKLLTVRNLGEVGVKTTTIAFEPTLNEPENATGQKGYGALTGPRALWAILDREQWDKLGFVLFCTFHRDEMLWQQFHEQYESALREGINSAGPGLAADDILSKI
ncbi:uncharacterized protein APUU_61235S [Aspergillus puulaauensis]|uniref:Uncharacterized protein n=1 Tax=Aspergillus puulaauensis TaxID=1220207 RepID=A0A7R7XVH4_9EURO|nr:uncharacterized protein APUU_61235S [Aspergillus puulaauensis]BCS28187.1 hypothetical protein APUU_61235S [Aspergillus puulaauensis]